MRIATRFYLGAAVIGLAGVLAATPSAQLNAQVTVAIDNDDIGGVVTGASGPEAGVAGSESVHANIGRLALFHRMSQFGQYQFCDMNDPPGSFKPGGLLCAAACCWSRDKPETAAAASVVLTPFGPRAFFRQESSHACTAG